MGGKDVKGKVKGVFGFIKHLVKDPVKTKEELKQRWIKLLLFFAISLGVTIGCGAISGFIMKATEEYDNIISKILNVPVAIGALGALFSFFLIWILLIVTLAMKQRECDKCKSLVTYDDNTSYEIIKQWEKKEVSSNNGRTNVTQTEIALIKISCICQKCSAEKIIQREFKVEQYLNGNLRFSHEIDDLVKGFLTGEYIN